MPAPKKKSGGNFRAHVFVADCMNYEKSFKGTTQAAADKAAIDWAKNESRLDDTEFIVLSGTGMLVAPENPDERPIIVRPVRPEDDNAIVIGN